jgi:hypothetical protein
MGSLYSFNGLEDSILDEIYGWETFLACPTEESQVIKSFSCKDLCPINTSTRLDHWLDLSA